MLRRVLWMLCVSRVPVCVSLVCALSAANAGAGLDDRVNSTVAGANLGKTVVGICVIDLRDGGERPVVEIGSERPMIPASNMKLLTSGTALMVLGEDFRFQTEFSRSGDELVVRGDGDPLFGDPDVLHARGLTARGFVDEIVRAVGRDGPFSGVVVDARVFDEQMVHPDWDAVDLTRAYGAPVCGLSFHSNNVRFFLTCSRDGGNPSVRTQPEAPWLEVRNSVRQVQKGSNVISLIRRGDYSYEARGTLRVNQVTPLDAPMASPGTIFGRLLCDALAESGVVAGRCRTRPAEDGESLERSGPVLHIESTDLAEVLVRCNHDSSNLCSEALLKRTARAATGTTGAWATGTQVVRMKVADLLGADAAASVVIRDGSGLSRKNRLSAGVLAGWLAEVAHSSVGDAFIQSLPVAGIHGTLERRFEDVELTHTACAKSGYMRGIYTLSGYLLDEEGEAMASFSVLLNDVPAGRGRDARRLHERIVDEIDDWLVEQEAGVAAVR